MTDEIYYYCRFCAERLAARLVMDFDSHPTVREDVQKKLSIFQHTFIDLDLKILPQSICKSCYETLNRAFLFVNNVRKSQIVLIELYLDIVGSDDDDNEGSLSKTRPSVEDPLCVNREDTTIHEEPNTSISVDEEDFSINKNKCVGAEAIKDLSDEGATSLGRHEPNVDRVLVNLNSTATENDTSVSQNYESVTIIECKEETTENDEQTDITVNIDSIGDSGAILKETASSQNQESLYCKEETSDNDYEDTELYPLDVTTDIYPIVRETLSLQGQDTYESPGEVTSSGHDSVCKEPNVDSELFNLNTTATGKDTTTPLNHELITTIKYKEETTDSEEDSDKIYKTYSTEDRASGVTETAASKTQDSVESIEQKKQNKRRTENIDKDYDESQQKKKRKKETDDNDYENSNSKDQIDSNTDSDPILKKTVPIHRLETSEFQKILTAKDPRVDKVSVSVVTWNTNLYECKLCDSKFSDINSLREHCKSLHQVCNGFRCRECSMELADFDTFVSHHREHRPKLEGFCQFCNMELKSAGAGHVASHGDLFCKFCGEVFTSASGFKEHYLLYAPEAVNNGRSHCVHCGHEHCNDDTPHRDSLSDACVACGEHFREQTLQQQHISKLENDTFFSTDAINIDKENMSNLYIKILKNGKNCFVRKYFECDHCHKQFKLKSALRLHMGIHYDVNPFYCKFCDAKFKLHRHWKRHLKTSKHARAVAGETSSTRLNKYFECDHCHKQFKLKSVLRQHMIIHYDVNPFYCKFCDAKFKRHRDWLIHLKTDKHARAAGATSSVTLEKYFECDHCQKRFKLKKLLKYHLLVHYDVFPFKCGHCDKKYKLKYSYRNHLRNCHNPSATRFECDLCHKQYKCEDYLKRHMVSHNDVYPFYCKLCDAKFKRSEYLKLHLKSGKHARVAAGATGSVKLEKYFECDHCHKQFKWKIKLQEHMATHYDVYPFYCKLCDAKFKWRGNFNSHLKSGKHASVAAGDTSSVTFEYFECDHCHKRFKTKYLLQQHMAMHYNLKKHLKTSKHARAAVETNSVTLEKYFECDHCHKRLKKYIYLKNHLAVHKDVFPFKCGQCKAKFKLKHSYRHHLTLSHNPATQYECDHCHKTYKYKSSLRHHVLTTHCDVYPFYCKLCDAKFKQRRYWMKHLNSNKHASVAAGETNSLKFEYFECDHCHKQFTPKSLLQRHMISHYDVYQFFCKLCDAKFKRSDYLNLHLKSDKHARVAAGATGSVKLEKYFECDHCQKRFKLKAPLKKHMAIHYDVYPFYCKLCDAKFKWRLCWMQHLNSNKHARAAAGDTSSVTFEYFECEHCHKRFKTKYLLQQHIAMHYEVYPFSCKLCDAKFKRRSDLKVHLKSVKHARAAAGETISNVRIQKYFECDHCHKQFKRKAQLQLHMAMHYDVYPFYCKLCDAKFKRSDYLNFHLKSGKHARAAAGATGSVKLEKYFECDHCHKQFKWKNNLQLHMAMHYDVYPFYCKLCDAKFKRRDHLNSHLKSGKHASIAAGDTSSVTLEKYFECDHCHRQFKRKIYLQQHMATHYDVSPLYCKLCDAKFKQRCYWKQHLKTSKHVRAVGAALSKTI